MSRGGSDRRQAPDINGLTSLKIDNLSYQTTPNDLRRVFERYGEIGDVHIPRDKYSRQSKGFGFVRFYERRDAEYALDRTDGKTVDGRDMRVTLAKYDRPADDRAARGGGGRRRSRSPRRRSRSPRYSRSRSPRRSRSRTRSPPSRDRRRDSPRGGDRSRSRSRDASPPPAKDRRSKSPAASRSPSRSASRSRSGSPR